ncbi:MaoC/PaaZ C-terminal domain-containing protein [Xanthobacteraceae bacterium A53D]
MTVAIGGASALYFDDVVVGGEYVSGPRLVTERDLDAFAEISGDHHPIHTDEAFARRTPFGQRILHGPFGVAVALGLFTQFSQFMDAAIAVTDIQDWRFRAPVFIGDQLTLRMRITAKRMVSAGGRGIVQRHMALENQGGTVVQEGVMGLMMACRAPVPSSRGQPVG